MLAAGHYTAERYKTALPLREPGISLHRNVVDMPESAAGPQAKLQQRPADPKSLLKHSMEMHEDCLERVDPALA
jgi:hypothetical protein